MAATATQGSFVSRTKKIEQERLTKRQFELLVVSNF